MDDFRCFPAGCSEHRILLFRAMLPFSDDVDVFESLSGFLYRIIDMVGTVHTQTDMTSKTAFRQHSELHRTSAKFGERAFSYADPIDREVLIIQHELACIVSQNANSRLAY